MIQRTNKIIVFLFKLHYVLPRPSLFTKYKSFARRLLEYGDIIYDILLYNKTYIQQLFLK